MVERIVSPEDEELVAMMQMSQEERIEWAAKQLAKLEKEEE